MFYNINPFCRKLYYDWIGSSIQQNIFSLIILCLDDKSSTHETLEVFGGHDGWWWQCSGEPIYLVIKRFRIRLLLPLLEKKIWTKKSPSKDEVKEKWFELKQSSLVCNVDKEPELGPELRPRFRPPISGSTFRSRSDRTSGRRCPSPSSPSDLRRIRGPGINTIKYFAVNELL